MTKPKEIESLETTRTQQEEKSISHKVVLHEFYSLPTELLARRPSTPKKPVQHGIARGNVVWHDILRKVYGNATETRRMSCGTTFLRTPRHSSLRTYKYNVLP